MSKMIAMDWRINRNLVDAMLPTPPYYLVSEDLFAPAKDRELFVKHIYSAAKDVPKRGPVIMSPGVSSNANLFRIDDKGNNLQLNEPNSFANLLAAEGFDVYLFHPGYAERVYTRYVSRHCKNSTYYKKKYRVSNKYSYKDLVDIELPAVINFVCEYSEKDELSWIGYSLGGMTAYSLMAKRPDNPIKNLITIGSPMAFNKIFFRFIRYINFTTTLLGFEEDALLGNLAQNMVPLTRTIRTLPDWFIRFNLLSPYLFNPMNISNATIRTLLGQITEPMPRALQRFFIQYIHTGGYSAKEKITNYLNQLRQLRHTNKNFLFFYGTEDLIASPESVFLAREVISPDDPENLIASSSAGHIDLIVGNNAHEQVWKPAVEWLKIKNQEA